MTTLMAARASTAQPLPPAMLAVQTTQPRHAFRPLPDTVPRRRLQQAETRHANLLLDLQRVIDDEPTLCHFEEVEKLLKKLASIGGVRALTNP